jgi:hypothetical protein
MCVCVCVCVCMCVCAYLRIDLRQLRFCKERLEFFWYYKMESEKFIAFFLFSSLPLLLTSL